MLRRTGQPAGTGCWWQYREPRLSGLEPPGRLARALRQFELRAERRAAMLWAMNRTFRRVWFLPLQGRKPAWHRGSGPDCRIEPQPRSARSRCHHARRMAWADPTSFRRTPERRGQIHRVHRPLQAAWALHLSMERWTEASVRQYYSSFFMPVSTKSLATGVRISVSTGPGVPPDAVVPG